MSELAEKIWALTGTGSDEPMIFKRWADKVNALVESEMQLERAALLRKAATVGHTAAFNFLGMAATQREYSWHDVEGALTKGSEAVLALIPKESADESGH